MRERKNGWNYRVMRAVDKAAPMAANSEPYYAIYEVYYDGDQVSGWTEEPCGSPFGETMEEMIKDLAWIMAGLTKPILDHDTGVEVEPARLLADDLQRMLSGEVIISGVKQPA